MQPNPLKVNPDTTYVYLLLNADLTISLMEELKGRPYYRQALKNAGNNFLKELERMTNEDIPLVWGINDTVMYELMDYIKKLNENLATLRPEDVAVVNRFIDIYKMEPDAICKMMSMVINDPKKSITDVKVFEPESKMMNIKCLQSRCTLNEDGACKHDSPVITINGDGSAICWSIEGALILNDEFNEELI